jgi:hypothetical protein
MKKISSLMGNLLLPLNFVMMNKDYKELFFQFSFLSSSYILSFVPHLNITFMDVTLYCCKFFILLMLLRQNFIQHSTYILALNTISRFLRVAFILLSHFFPLFSHLLTDFIANFFFNSPFSQNRSFYRILRVTKH